MDKWDEIHQRLVNEREKLFELEDSYRDQKNELDRQRDIIENVYRELDQDFEVKYQTIVADYPKLEGATEEMYQAAKHTIERYQMANDAQFHHQTVILDEKYHELEIDFKRAIRKQEDRVEYYQSELRNCE